MSNGCSGWGTSECEGDRHLLCLKERDVQLEMKVLWDGHLARPNLGGQDAHPTIRSRILKKELHIAID